MTDFEGTPLHIGDEVVYFDKTWEKGPIVLLRSKVDELQFETVKLESKVYKHSKELYKIVPQAPEPQWDEGGDEPETEET